MGVLHACASTPTVRHACVACVVLFLPSRKPGSDMDNFVEKSPSIKVRLFIGLYLTETFVTRTDDFVLT